MVHGATRLTYARLYERARRLASALEKSAQDGFDAGTTETLVDLEGIYDLRLLNAVLEDLGLDTVSAGGLGEE